MAARRRGRNPRRMSTHATARRSVVVEDRDAVATARDVVRQYGDGDAAVHALRGVSLDIAQAA